MEVYYIIFTVCVTAAATAIVIAGRSASRKQIATERQQALDNGYAAQEYRTQLSQAEIRIALLEQELQHQSIQQQSLQAEISAERTRLVDAFEKERAQQNSVFTLKFETLASEILDRKSRTMSDANRQSIGDMLKPFSESVERFRHRIEEESRQRFALEKEVQRLAELNLRMSKEANDLTSALKGNSKYQGDWGEMILETLLENSGLVRDKHFRVQQSIRDQAGILLRPDVILSLPDQKEIIVDSKVSLNAYAAYCEADQDETRKRNMASHITSVKNHIIELGTKNYSQLVNSPDFVIMFIPNEPAFLLALQGDGSLWNEAYSRGVILSSPTNLFAILRIVDDLWRRDTQSKNALEIARQGGDLYDKFVSFAETFADVGAAIRKSEELYDKSMGQLSTGRGNLVSRTEKLRTLGIKTSKKLSKNLIPDNEELQTGTLPASGEENIGTQPTLYNYHKEE